MKTKLVVSAILMVCASSAAMAQAKAPEPDYTLAYNVGLTTDYRYRGISQSRFQPAVSVGADFSHKNGLYLGAWLSTIKWIGDNSLSGAGVKGPVELDLYGGYKGEISKDLGFDVGLLQYAYLGNSLSNTAKGGVYANANTTEVYGALTYGPITAKYSHSLSRLFGAYGSVGSGYFDVTGTFDLGNGWSVAPHIGYVSVGSTAKKIYGTSLSYTDYSLAVNKDFGNGFVGTLAAVGTNAEKAFYASPVNGKNLGKSGLVLSAKYNF